MLVKKKEKNWEILNIRVLQFALWLALKMCTPSQPIKFKTTTSRDLPFAFSRASVCFFLTVNSHQLRVIVAFPLIGRYLFLTCNKFLASRVLPE